MTTQPSRKPTIFREVVAVHVRRRPRHIEVVPVLGLDLIAVDDVKALLAELERAMDMLCNTKGGIREIQNLAQHNLAELRAFRAAIEEIQGLWNDGEACSAIAILALSSSKESI